MKVSVTVGWLGVGILPGTKFLIPLRRDVNMKVIELNAFDFVRMFLAFAVVAPEAKELA